MANSVFTVGALYAVASKRKGSKFKMVVRLCELRETPISKPLLYLENFDNGNLIAVAVETKYLGSGQYELDPGWDEAGLDHRELSTCAKSFILYSNNLLHNLM